MNEADTKKMHDRMKKQSLEQSAFAKEAYEAGKECALNGPNQENCSPRHFRRLYYVDSWERGFSGNPMDSGPEDIP